MRNKPLLHRVSHRLMSYFNVFPCDKNLEGLTHNLKDKYGYQHTKALQKPVDINHEPLPWFTYPAIEYLAQLDLSNKSIFEWGSGNSSLFLAKRCRQITSIESSKKWYEYCSQNLLPNQKILLREEAEFAEAVDESDSKFDLIVIDSMRRGECAQKSIKHLNSGGLIILDNSDWHPNTSAFLRDNCNLIEVDMHGFGPINAYSWTTSLYFHREFCFPPKGNKQPALSKAGIDQLSKYDCLK